MSTLSARDALIRMADQSNAAGASNAPPAYETKNLPHGYAPAAVPFTDSTHVDRDAAEDAPEGGSTETIGDTKPVGTRKTGSSKS